MDIILKYFHGLTDLQKDQFSKLPALYSHWNEQINVISRQDIDNLYEKHILHSLAIAKVINFKNGSEILDVGTGGGFPGIPLAILFPECQFHLVDSIGKKIKVVTEVAQALGLKNVRAEQIRGEQIDYQYDFVVTRAVTRIKPFTDWMRGKFNNNQYNKLKNGILFLKGGDLSEELKEYGKKTKTYELYEIFEEEFFETKKIIYVQMTK